MLKKRSPIYQRIILYQIISIIFTMAVFGFISYHTSLSREIRSMKETTDQVAKRLTSQLSLPFWNLDKPSAENLLLQEVKNPYLSGIAIIQKGRIWVGKYVAEDNSILPLEGPDKHPDPPLLQEQEAPRRSIVYTDKKGGTWDLGELVLYTTDKRIDSSLQSLLLQTVFQTVLLILTLSIFTIIVLNLVLHKPLQQITSAAQRIGNGEIELQAEVTGPREIATLATAFNTMTSRLRESLDELDRYFTSALDLLCIADTDGHFRRLNKEWETTLGYSVKELEGRSFLDFVHPADMEKTLKEIARLRENIEVLNFVNRYRHKDGSYRWIEWRSFPHGSLIYAVARDITERKQSEDEVRRLNESLEERVAERTARLEEMNRELETFAYSIAHDLRAPLRAINGYTHMISEHYRAGLDEEGSRLLSVVQNEAHRMDKMITSLLDLSRIGRSPLKWEPLDMTDMARSVFEEITTPGMRKRIVFSSGNLPEANGDIALIRLVWMNLLSNAVKFSGKKKKATIAIEGSENGTDLVYHVHDNGAGFDMQYSGKLFGIFQRLHTPNDFEGNGIGLALVHRIITLHGGRVWAESEPDKGTTFSFALPRQT